MYKYWIYMAFVDALFNTNNWKRKKWTTQRGFRVTFILKFCYALNLKNAFKIIILL